MKQKLLSFFLFLLLMNISLAQQSRIDSLQVLLSHSKDDTSKVNVLNKLSFNVLGNNSEQALKYGLMALTLSEKIKFDQGKEDALNEIGLSYYYKGEFDSALIFHKKSLAINEKRSDKKGMGISYNNLGNVYFDKAEYVSALKFLLLALKVRQELKDKGEIATTLGNVGNVYHVIGEVDKCLMYYFQSLALHEETGNEKSEAVVLRNIGVVYLEMNKPEKALEYYLKSYSILQRIGDKKEMAAILNNLGNFYHDQGYYISDSSINASSETKKKLLLRRAKEKFDTAISYYEKSLAIRTILGDKRGIADSYNNIANVYYDSFDNKKAIEYNVKSLKIHEGIDSKQGIALTYGNLGLIYIDMNEYKQALKYFFKQLSLAKLINDRAMILGAYEYISDCYGRLTDYRMAYEYYVRYSELKDSSINAQSVAKIAEYQTKYEAEKKENIISTMKLTMKNDQLLLESTMSSASNTQKFLLGILVILALLFFLYKNRRKRKEEQLSGQIMKVEMNSLRSQMNPHFISNSLNSIDDYILKNEVEKSSEYLNKFSRLMRMILESSRLEEISLKQDLAALELYIQLENLRLKNRVTYSINLSSEINSDQVLIPPMLLQPFVENAFKHAYEGIQNPSLTVNIFIQNEMLHCSVSDNGIGRFTSQKIVTRKSERLGLQVTKERLEIINKLKNSNAFLTIKDLKIDSESKGGTQVELAVPLRF